MVVKKVFISYCQESSSHVELAASLTAELRLSGGLDVEIDLMLRENETAIDFFKMMHKSIGQSDKVIIILSPEYKRRADTFTSGVGTEYELIIKDIKNNDRKYVLITFHGRSREIFPLALMDRDTIDLSPNLPADVFKKNYDTLLYKLHDVKQYVFPPVNQQKPTLNTTSIKRLFDNSIKEEFPKKKQ